MNKEEEEIRRKNIQKRMREDSILKAMAKMDLLRDVVKHLDWINRSYDKNENTLALDCAIDVFIAQLEKHDIRYDKENETFYLTKDYLTNNVGEVIFYNRKNAKW